jgi:hypothetical protein
MKGIHKNSNLMGNAIHLDSPSANLRASARGIISSPPPFPVPNAPHAIDSAHASTSATIRPAPQKVPDDWNSVIGLPHADQRPKRDTNTPSRASSRVRRYGDQDYVPLVSRTLFDSKKDVTLSSKAKTIVKAKTKPNAAKAKVNVKAKDTPMGIEGREPKNPTASLTQETSAKKKRESSSCKSTPTKRYRP